MRSRRLIFRGRQVRTKKPLSRAEVLAAMAKPGRSKYGNIKTVVRGEKFDSIKEAERWKELCLLEKAGMIKELRHHVVMNILVYDNAGLATKVGIYTCDFLYWTTRRDGSPLKRIIEDVKSVATAKDPLWRFKKKVLAAIGIDVTEVI